MSTSSEHGVRQADGPPAGEVSTLAVRVGGGTYGLPLDQIDEVVRMPRLGALPGAPDGILGCLDLRGTHLLVVDLLRRLEGTAEAVHPSQVLIVVRIGTRRLALRASAVDEVLTRPVGPPPDGAPPLPSVVGLLEGTAPPVSLLDLDLLLDPELKARAGDCDHEVP